jgi:hypothetical protein
MSLNLSGKKCVDNILQGKGAAVFYPPPYQVAKAAKDCFPSVSPKGFTELNILLSY